MLARCRLESPMPIWIYLVGKWARMDFFADSPHEILKFPGSEEKVGSEYLSGIGG